MLRTRPEYVSCPADTQMLSLHRSYTYPAEAELIPYALKLRLM